MFAVNLLCDIMFAVKCCGQRQGRPSTTLSLPRGAVQAEILTAAGSELNNAINNPFFGAL